MTGYCLIYSKSLDNGLRTTICRNLKWFRGGLVSEPHELMYHSTLDSRVIKKKKKKKVEGEELGAVPHVGPRAILQMPRARIPVENQIPSQSGPGVLKSGMGCLTTFADLTTCADLTTFALFIGYQTSMTTY